jgi:hypothetical protein
MKNFKILLMFSAGIVVSSAVYSSGSPPAVDETKKDCIALETLPMCDYTIAIEPVKQLAIIVELPELKGLVLYPTILVIGKEDTKGYKPGSEMYCIRDSC